MLIVFRDMKGAIPIDFFEKGATVNCDSYCLLLRQYSPYLLNNSYLFIYIYIYIYCIKFFLHKLSLMLGWLLIIFGIGFFSDFRRVSKPIFEIFFPLLKSFFLTGIFKFCSLCALSSTHFIYCLPCYSLLFISE